MKSCQGHAAICTKVPPFEAASEECPPDEEKSCEVPRRRRSEQRNLKKDSCIVNRPLHDTVLKRYRVAAGSARPLRDYHLMHDSSFIHDYRLPRDPSYSTILPSFTTTSALAIPLWKSLPESRAAPTIPPWKSLPESPPAPTHRVPSRPNFTPVAAPPTRHTRARGGLIRTAIRFRADW